MQRRIDLLWLFGFNLVILLLAGCGEDISFTLNLEGYISNTGDRFTPVVQIQNTWTEHNIFHQGRKGMRIHVQFKIDGQRERKCSLDAYFYFKNGEPLKDFNGLYTNSEGNVALEEFFTPTYGNSRYENFIMFMPVEELHMSKGKHELKFHLVVWGRDENDEWIKLAVSEWFYFTYTRG
jgi:hypothetical protein